MTISTLKLIDRNIIDIYQELVATTSKATMTMIVYSGLFCVEEFIV
jgi:hypothetical protein